MPFKQSADPAGYWRILTDFPQGIGAAKDAVRMQRVISFYEKLPRGSAQEVKPKGLIGRYQAKYFGKNPSAARMYTSQKRLMCVY